MGVKEMGVSRFVGSDNGEKAEETMKLEIVSEDEPQSIYNLLFKEYDSGGNT